MNLRQLIPPAIINGYQKLLRLKRSRYKIGQFEIKVPPNLALPDLQKKYKLYDRFLPVLAKVLPPGEKIVDIGATIGDTSVALIQECENEVICIEPSDFFYPYLVQNIDSLPGKYKDQLTVLKKFVGTGGVSGELTHTDAGTATITVVQKSNIVTHQPLDEMIKAHSDIILIKVDTDGFDFDVLKSAEKILSESQPILFWENQIDEPFQSIGFSDLYHMLEEKGYKYIYVFDNFGNLITEETNFDTLKNLNEYIFSMKQGNIARTLFYTDILATTERYHSLAATAIIEYKKKWINGSNAY